MKKDLDSQLYVHGDIYCIIYTKEDWFKLTFQQWLDVCGLNMDHILHRIDGPAIEFVSGTKEWWVNGRRHRSDGPAVIEPDGTKEWIVDGKRHRLDGPAVEAPDGLQMWYIHDKQLDRIEVEKWIKENNIDLSTEADQIAFKMRWS